MKLTMGNRGISVMTPFVLTASGSCQHTVSFRLLAVTSSGRARPRERWPERRVRRPAREALLCSGQNVGLDLRCVVDFQKFML